MSNNNIYGFDPSKDPDELYSEISGWISGFIADDYNGRLECGCQSPEFIKYDMWYDDSGESRDSILESLIFSPDFLNTDWPAVARTVCKSDDCPFDTEYLVEDGFWIDFADFDYIEAHRNDVYARKPFFTYTYGLAFGESFISQLVFDTDFYSDVLDDLANDPPISDAEALILGIC